MNLYELEWHIKDRLRQDREFAAHQAMLGQALAGRPGIRLRFGILLIRLGTWLRDSAKEADTEVERVTA
ncbi:MAG: hypothetical protein HY726_08505 [Candidatus Rokubacteria bacterium]|nr:hypothetical protein [Candidatus Rokubacteria bacterium]